MTTDEIPKLTTETADNIFDGVLDVDVAYVWFRHILFIVIYLNEIAITV